jgi:hypothetical protein
MDVSFDTADLAALCNSERRMAERWGTDMGMLIGRRLLDVAASTAATLDRIPTAHVANDGAGKTIVTFADTIVVRGRIEPSEYSADQAAADAERFVIASVEVEGRKAR